MGNLLSYLPTFKRKESDRVESVPDEDIHQILSRTTEFKQTNTNDPDDMVNALKEEGHVLKLLFVYCCADDSEAAQGDVVTMDKAKPEDITAGQTVHEESERDGFKADDSEAAQGDVVTMDKAKPEDITAAELQSQHTEPELHRSLLGRLFTKNQGNREKWRRERMVGKVVGSYTVGERLSKGNTSVIYRVEQPDSKEMDQPMARQFTILSYEVFRAGFVHRPSNFICKVTDGKYRDGLQKEFDILRSVEHPNIVTVFDCMSLNKVVAMVMEDIGKLDLHDFIIQNWPIAPTTRRTFSSQILSAVAAIHSKGIAHCGIKLENILISNRRDLKLTDFCSAIKVSEATFESFKSTANTPEYLPPEIICACADWSSYDIRAIDQWSVGVVLFLLLTGRFPFGEVKGLKKYTDMLKTSPVIELRQNEKHLLFSETGYIDKVRGLLQFNHPKRTSIARVLEMPYYQKINMESLMGQR